MVEAQHCLNPHVQIEEPVTLVGPNSSSRQNALAQIMSPCAPLSALQVLQPKSCWRSYALEEIYPGNQVAHSQQQAAISPKEYYQAAYQLQNTKHLLQLDDATPNIPFQQDQC